MTRAPPATLNPPPLGGGNREFKYDLVGGYLIGVSATNLDNGRVGYSKQMVTVGCDNSAIGFRSPPKPLLAFILLPPPTLGQFTTALINNEVIMPALLSSIV